MRSHGPCITQYNRWCGPSQLIARDLFREFFPMVCLLKPIGLASRVLADACHHSTGFGLKTQQQHLISRHQRYSATSMRSPCTDTSLSPCDHDFLARLSCYCTAMPYGRPVPSSRPNWG